MSATAPRIRLACADPECPCRHAQAAGVPTWQGPDGFRRGVTEIDTPADVRVLYLAPERLARSRWFKHTSEVA